MDYPEKRKRHRVWEYDADEKPVRKVTRYRQRYEWVAPNGWVYTAPPTPEGKAILDRRRKA